MNATYTEERLEELDREVGGLIASLEGGSSSGSSQERIDRILRRVRLEERIQGESDAARDPIDEDPDTAPHKDSDSKE